MIRLMTPKQLFLEKYDAEIERTKRLLRAYPPDKLDLKPAAQSKTARELAWMFVLECRLAGWIWNDEIAKGTAPRSPAPPPEKWDELLSAFEKESGDCRALVASTSDADLDGIVHFFTGPKQLGEYTRMGFAWFLLFDQIHHRGQFSVYLRMSGAKVPSIYGPSADEPWR